MKDISELSKDIDKIYNKFINKMAIVQQEQARETWGDVVSQSPVKSGEYVSSIKISDTTLKNGVLSTKIYTDLLTEDGYVLGRMLENGTGIYALEPHIGHTETFKKSGYRYWYVPAKSVREPIGRKIVINGEEFYVAHAQPSRPHFKPAYDMNVPRYREKISKAIKEL